MTGTIIGGIAVATIGLAKEAVSQYGKYKTEKARGRWKLGVAVAAAVTAIAVATPKAIELYKAHREKRLKP